MLRIAEAYVNGIFGRGIFGRCKDARNGRVDGKKSFGEI